MTRDRWWRCSAPFICREKGTDMKLTITNIQYHRNGVSGDGFFAVYFDQPGQKDQSTTDHLVAVVPAYLVPERNEDGEEYQDSKKLREARHVAVGEKDLYVLNLTDPDEKYRGDWYWEHLLTVLDQHHRAAWPGLYPKEVAKLPVIIETTA